MKASTLGALRLMAAHLHVVCLPASALSALATMCH
jgi:hypothetical protein